MLTAKTDGPRTKCAHPICFQRENLLIFVIKLPTVRTLMMDLPSLPMNLVGNQDLMRRAALSAPIIIQQYESNLAAYKQDSGTFINTDKPTYLISRTALCPRHRMGFKLTDWLPATEIRKLQEMARLKGFKIPEPLLIPIEFKPLGWQPEHEYLEIQR